MRFLKNMARRRIAGLGPRRWEGKLLYRLREKPLSPPVVAVKEIIVRKIVVSALAALFSASAMPSLASPIGPVYPAPGGNDFSSSGTAGNTGGSNRTYDNFDTSAFDQLYWGFSDVKGPLGDNASQLFANATATQVGSDFVWTSPLNWTFNTTSGPQSVPVTFTTHFSALVGGADLSGNVVTGSSLGIATMPFLLEMDAASLLSWGGGFVVSAAFTVPGGAGINNYYNSFNTFCSGPCVQSSTVGAFYYTEPTAPVPEPASLVLLGTGLLGTGAGIRRRIRARA